MFHTPDPRVSSATARLPEFLFYSSRWVRFWRVQIFPSPSSRQLLYGRKSQDKESTRRLVRWPLCLPSFIPLELSIRLKVSEVSRARWRESRQRPASNFSTTPLFGRSSLKPVES